MLKRNFSVNKRTCVSAQGISEDIFDGLVKRLSQFELIWGDDVSPEDTDIVITQVDNLWPDVPGQARQMDALYGFWVTVKNDVPHVVQFHKNCAILSVSFCEKIVINVHAPANIKLSKLVGRLYILLLYCIRVSLQTKGCLLIHGGAFTRLKHDQEQRSLLLLGQRGIRKTMVSLTLMHKGWHYISDDKFILEQHNAFKFQKSILVRDHHFDQLPWLNEVIADAEKFLKNQQWRKLFRKLAYRFVPKKLLPNEDRLLNKGINCQVSDLFPEQISQKSNTPGQVFILKNGEKFRLQEVDKSSAIKDIQLLQRMANAEFNDLDDQLSFSHAPYAFTPSTEDFHRHFPNQQYFLLSIPYTMSVEAICNEIIRCIDCP